MRRFAETIDHYVQDFLPERDIDFRTLALSEERDVKVVIEGVLSHTFSNIIRQTLSYWSFMLVKGREKK